MVKHISCHSPDNMGVKGGIAKALNKYIWAKGVKGIQKYNLIKYVSHGDVMYSVRTIVKTVLHI